MGKERAGFGIEDEGIDFDTVLNIPAPPEPTAEEKKLVEKTSKEMGFPSRQPPLEDKSEVKKTDKAKMKAISFLIDESLHKAFKIKTAQNGERMVDVMERFIENYINS